MSSTIHCIYVFKRVKCISQFPTQPHRQRLADTTSRWNLKLLHHHHQMSHDVQNKENYYILDPGIRKIIKPNYKAMIYLPLI